MRIYVDFYLSIYSKESQFFLHINYSFYRLFILSFVGINSLGFFVMYSLCRILIR